MGYKDENVKHRVGITMPIDNYKCPNCSGPIKTKASFVVCKSCGKVVEGKDLKK